MFDDGSQDFGIATAGWEFPAAQASLELEDPGAVGNSGHGRNWTFCRSLGSSEILFPWRKLANRLPRIEHLQPKYPDLASNLILFSSTRRPTTATFVKRPSFHTERGRAN
jgi:hypothetical protein